MLGQLARLGRGGGDRYRGRVRHPGLRRSRGLARLGVDVPGRISVASFDGLPFAAIVRPSLTAISLPAFDLGFEAATLLEDIIERGNQALRTVVLPSRLNVVGLALAGRRYNACAAAAPPRSGPAALSAMPSSA